MQPHADRRSRAVEETRSLSPLDLAFFVLESRERMSNIGPLAILKTPPGTRSIGRWADRLLAQMRKRAVGAPFNLRYVAPGLRGLPRLETAPEIDLDRHCHRITLEAPGSDEQLFAAVCRLHEKRLDRSRPPWEFYVIDGLERGRVALYAKVHHGLIDGRGFVEVCTHWFTADPADRTARAFWEGPPPRAAAARRRLDVATLAASAGGAAQSMLSLYTALARQALASAKVISGMPLPFVGTPSALRARPSVRRSFAYCVLPLARLKTYGKAHDASVNDVLLTVVDMALNRYLAAHGGREGERPLVVDMPVALSGAGANGNRIAVLQFPLGAAAASPDERLRQVLTRTAEIKQYVKRTSASALVTYTAAVHGVPALLETLGLSRMPTLANVMISNPFGLPERRYLAGAELEMALPVSVLAPGQSLNITAVTYDQGLQLGFVGLAAELPDIQQLADLTVAAFDELMAATPDRATSHPAKSARHAASSSKRPTQARRQAA